GEPFTTPAPHSERPTVESNPTPSAPGRSGSTSMPERGNHMRMLLRLHMPSWLFARRFLYRNRFMLGQVVVSMSIGRCRPLWKIVSGTDLPTDSITLHRPMAFRLMGLALETS